MPNREALFAVVRDTFSVARWTSLPGPLCLIQTWTRCGTVLEEL